MRKRKTKSVSYHICKYWKNLLQLAWYFLQIIMPRLGWRWLLALSSIPSFAALLLYIFTVESPRYLCAEGRISDAHDILRKIAVVNQTKLPPGMLVSDQVTQLDEEEELLRPRANKIFNFKTGLSSSLMLLSPQLLRITLLMWVVYFGNSFAYYGIILLTSQFSAGENQCFSVALHVKNDTSLYTDVFITSLAGTSTFIFLCQIVILLFHLSSHLT